MTGNEAEPTLSTTGEQGVTGAEQRWGQTRQRAADLFSSHRYRALQLSLFERKASKGRGAGAAAAPLVAAPLVNTPLVNTPFADAPLAGAPPVDPTPAAFDRFAPVPMTGAIPVVGAAELGGDLDAATAEFALMADQAALDQGFGDQGYGAQGYVEHGYGEQAPGSSWSENGEWQAGAQVSAAGAPEGELDNSATATPGRNLRTATAVGLGLLGAALFAAWLHPIAFAVLLYTFACGAVIEWKRALENHGRYIPLVPLLGATIGMGVATWYAKPEGLVVALLVGCAGVVAWRIGDERVENTLADALAGVLTLLWIPFLASFLFLLEVADDGWQRVFIIVLAVVGNDTGGLVAGMTLGRHKLLPRVSPAKTWEGAVGGVLLGTAAASVAAFFFFDGAWYIGAAVGAAAAIASIIGDLAESALKRDIRVKDMSSVIPGHGGILDRIDSLLFAAPVGYVVFAIFLGTLGGGGL